MSLVQTPDGSIFEQLLKCAGCHQMCIPPFEICQNGHLLCNGCVTHHSMLCQLCEADMLQSPIPALEELINDSLFHCKFLTDGCQQVLKGSEIRKHHLSCEFR